MRGIQAIGTSVGVLLAATASVINPMSFDLLKVTHGKQEKPFFVEVAANGVPADFKPKPLTPDQQGERVGQDLWIGASAAYRDLKSSLADSELQFQLVPVDDDDKPESAVAIAKKLQAEPRVIAVIGHGITKTTRPAAQLYAQSGIPLIVALATADDAIKDADGTSRLSNAYRLSPSDGKVQAPSIAYFIRMYRPASRTRGIHLLTSDEDGAHDYAVPLCHDIQAILKANGYAAELTSVEPLPATVEHVKTRHNDSDFLVYCGYPPEAAKLLGALNSAYSADKQHVPPPIILSDAVSPEISGDVGNLEVFRMAALDQARCTDLDALERIRRAAQPLDRPLTLEQIHGYDAVQVIAAAMKKCSGSISRTCINAQLNSGATYPSVCSDYSFRDGENLISDYYVFPGRGSSDTEATCQPK